MVTSILYRLSDPLRPFPGRQVCLISTEGPFRWLSRGDPRTQIGSMGPVWDAPPPTFRPVWAAPPPLLRAAAPRLQLCPLAVYGRPAIHVRARGGRQLYAFVTDPAWCALLADPPPA